MPPVTTFTSPLAEKSTALYTTALIDKTGAPINPSSVTVLTVTLLDSTGAIVNGRSNQNCFNVGDGALAIGGLLSFTIQPADTTVTGAAMLQVRLMTFHCVFTGGEIWHEVVYYVRNMDGVS